MPLELQFLIFLAAGYLVGAIPFGVLLAAAKGVNLRASGSGNVGATNVARAMGRPWGLLCFALDVAKGFLPVLVAGIILRAQASGLVLSPVRQGLWVAAGLGCIVGHVFPFWLKFRGGKGVATSLGVLLGVYPYFTWAGLIAFALWILLTWWSRYVSVGSIVSAVAFLPIFAAVNYFLLDVNPLALWPLGSFALAVVILILIRHRANLRRLLAGTENKIAPRSAGESS
jgi:glycerol-3-phosphate acyltransferase PlsY